MKPSAEPSAGGLPAGAAIGLIAIALGASALIGRRNAPDPSHPDIQQWYRRLDKPDFTPPDAVFGAVWPLLEAGLAFGGYRLLRHRAGRARNSAIGLWLLNTAMVEGWTELFFRRKRLGLSAAALGRYGGDGRSLCCGSTACRSSGGRSRHAICRLARVRYPVGGAIVEAE